jgi:mono/diheme cytochrome c family protein
MCPVFLPGATLAALLLVAEPASPAASAAAGPAAKVDFTTQILPIFQRSCVSCHGPEKASAGLQLVSARRLAKGGISDDLMVPGKARASYLVQRLRGQGGEDRMPIKGDALPEEEIAVIERWIDQGAVLPDEPPPQFVPGPGGLRRLTVAQYHNTLHDLLGPSVKLPDAARLEPDTLVAGSATVGAARVRLSAHGVEKFAAAATDLARQALADPKFRQRFLTCPPGGDCARAFVREFGRRAWRRPLTETEQARYLALVPPATQQDPDSLARALVPVVGALIQSPNFLYRSEIGEPDPTNPGRRRLNSFELASRLSYFLWGAPPDDALLDAAQSGALDTAAGLDAQTRRMLTSPRARQTMAAFFVELFRLRRLDRISENRTKYRQYSDTIGASMRGETLRVIEAVAFDPARDFREIFSVPFTFVNPELGRLYGLPVPDKLATQEFVRVNLPPASGRAGVLGQGSFLTIFAHPTTSSPTKRGKFIREALLCQAIPPPPPNVETKLPKDAEGQPARTTRQKLEVHRKNPRCNGCHKSMDPLGLAYEGFDGIGAGRSTEAGMPIDTSGEFDGQRFRQPAELGALLARSDRLGACVARALFRFALGHLESEGEEPLLEALARDLQKQGYRFPALVASVVKSEGFRALQDPKGVSP